MVLSDTAPVATGNGMEDSTVSGVSSITGQRPKPEEVIASRSGDVLGRFTMLKADHFPSCHNTKLDPIIEGAPNFRQVEGLPVFGVAIPTVTGLRRVLNLLGASKGQRKVYWQNLREEPLVFINGNPFVVRELDNPFANLEYTGIDRSRVEHMEVRLKQDILNEARKFGNSILVVHEKEDLSIYDHWEPVTAADVQTPNEVYAELRADGYDIDYLRVPVTDEKAPKDSDFELLLQRLWCVPAGAALMFNCQMGRGRTTTGMIIASMLYLRRLDAFPRSVPQGDDMIPQWFVRALAAPAAVGEQTRDKLKHGMYDVVRSLLRVLEQGTLAKAVLDAVTDACSAMQNLREAIGSYRARFLKETRERQRDTLMNVCLEYLERYYMLIAFASYLSSPSCNPTSLRHVSFPDWMARRPELRSILMRLLRRNSMAALEVHTPVDGAPVDALHTGLHQSDGVDTSAVIAERAGQVLGPFTILKEDNFPGLYSNKIQQTIEGAPNFRGLSGLPVYGVGMPTVDGIVSVLKTVSGSSSPNSSKRVNALWVNMREEPVVYIKGLPFVLREEVRPLKNLMEYAGIDADRLSSMEDRLKQDVLAEAQKFNGRVLVAHESQVSGRFGELYDTWEVISSPSDVQTSTEVYASLASQGFAVQFVRVPVTDGTSPTLADFDAIASSVLSFGLENPVIFNCQMGIGRTTAGMIIASLVHLYSTGSLKDHMGDPFSSQLSLVGDSEGLSRRLEGCQGVELEGQLSLQSARARGSWADATALLDKQPGGLTGGDVSPRSDAEGEDEFDVDGDERESKQVPPWSLDPEELAERKALAAGGFVGVRRVARLLEEGDNAKRTLDTVIDAASDLINLRVAIMKYRKPRSSYKYMRPETQQRHSAFKKGTAYLERYCLLIIFAYYLEHVGPESGTSFEAWLGTRPDLQAAFTAIHQNPAAALAPVPVARVPAIYEAEAGESSLEDQRHVLAKRKGRTLTKRTILKSYLSQATNSFLPQVPDLRQADGVPVFSVGNVRREGLCVLLQHLGAGPQGNTQVIISDVREELVVYVNGTPYLRRELEMPAAALHHAGIHATQLEELEVLLKEDVADESAIWGGKVLLHKEVLKARESTPGGTPTASATGGRTPVSFTPGGVNVNALTGRNERSVTGIPIAPDEASVQPGGRGSRRESADGNNSLTGNTEGGADGNGESDPSTPAARQGSRQQSGGSILSGSKGTAGSLTADRTPLTRTTSALLTPSSGSATTPAKRPDGEDVTALVDEYPGMAVAPFWAPVDPEKEGSLQTPREVLESLLKEGYKVFYRRIPLSRERTPEAEDIDLLHGQLIQQLQESQRALASNPAGARTVHLILSRTATGSSARFVAATFCSYFVQPRAVYTPNGALLSPVAATMTTALSFNSGSGAGGVNGGSAPHTPTAHHAHTHSAGQQSFIATGGVGSQSFGHSHGGASPSLSLDAGMGEYRGIMSLCRLLPGGFDAKLTVDQAVAKCSQIGNLLADIRKCKQQADSFHASGPVAIGEFAARQLGVHYLQRYFLLIAYRCFLDHRGSKKGSFADWMHSQKELAHLANHLTLDS